MDVSFYGSSELALLHLHCPVAGASSPLSVGLEFGDMRLVGLHDKIKAITVTFCGQMFPSNLGSSVVEPSTAFGEQTYGAHIPNSTFPSVYKHLAGRFRALVAEQYTVTYFKFLTLLVAVMTGIKFLQLWALGNNN